MERLKHLVWLLFAGVALIISIYGGFRLALRGLVLPRVSVGGVDVSGLDRASAEGLVKSFFEANPSRVVVVSNSNEVINLDGVKIERDFGWAVDQAVNVGRNGNLMTQISETVKVLWYGRAIDIPVRYSPEEISDLVDQVAERLNKPPVWPKITKNNKDYQLTAGTDGVTVRSGELTSEIVKRVSLPGVQEVAVPVDFVSTKVEEKLFREAVEALNKWSGREPSLKFQSFRKGLSEEEMMKLFGLTGEKIEANAFETLVSKLTPLVETEPRDAVFVFENNKVKEFKAEVVGSVIDRPAFKEKLASFLLTAEKDDLEIPMILTYPKIKAGDINNLGIKELLGSGKSSFSHSIPNRVFNVNLAASRVNGTLVAPGEEFSFNKAVGDISRATGYQTAYVISQGRTVLGDGGGVCQVSTTTFRAALSAGLPITERKAHAYRVGYYEQDSPPGIDATVYYPSADFKFLNNTDNYLLIQETVDTKNMTMQVDIYGTKDERVVTVSKPRISSQVPPPPTMYIDDPTIPAGVTKQVDWSAWGAKVAFDYKVEKGGEVMYEKTFISNYQPWRAIYLKGTGDVAMR